MESSDSEERELTVDEAVLVAISLQKQATVRARWRVVFARARGGAGPSGCRPHFSGVLAHQEGRTHDAVALIKRSLAVSPNHAQRATAISASCSRSVGRVDEAIAAYQRAIAIDPSHGNAHNNHGAVLRAAGRPEEAEVAYRTAISLEPGSCERLHEPGHLARRTEPNGRGLRVFLQGHHAAAPETS